MRPVSRGLTRNSHKDISRACCGSPRD
jgi:hypothetical protein